MLVVYIYVLITYLIFLTHNTIKFEFVIYSFLIHLIIMISVNDNIKKTINIKFLILLLFVHVLHNFKPETL
jgi:hypothetical protein